MSQQYESLSDENLTRLTKESDLTAFKVVYYRYYHRLCNFVWTRTNSVDLAEDLVQEIFTRLWVNRHRLTIRKSLKAYLYRMANNLIIDRYRKKTHQTEYIVQQIAKQSPAYSRDNDLRIDIESAIESLPEKLRTVFILSRFEGLKYNEIASVCHISIKAVESRIGRALRILRSRLSC